jgi:hypothetical protein
MTVIATEIGARCPRCWKALPQSIHSGPVTCPACNRGFEATVFAAPVAAPARVDEVVAIGPEGGSACANHARNAAVTSCQRCGLFICALCEMRLGSTALCPACFDRGRVDGTLDAGARRYRDYAGMARSAGIFGLLLFSFLGIPFGALTIYYAARGLTQRRTEGRSAVGVTVWMVIGVLEVIGGVMFIGFLIWSWGR